MGRIRRTLELAKASWEVLKADKELLALPVMSGVATIAIGATFLAPLLATAEEGDPGTVGYVVLFVAYLVLAFVTIFFNSALVWAADERLRGGDPTLRTALSGAAGHLPAILGWAAVSATVSIVLRAIEDRLGGVGAVISGLAGMAWSVVTFLVIPVLVIERLGVRAAIKRSAELFRRTWGENVAAQVGFGLLGFLAILPAIAVVVGGIAIGVPPLLVIAVGALWVALVVVVLSALNGIFQAALYHYAAAGDAPGAFGSAELAAAFQPSTRRRGGPGGFSGSGF